jgi:hypothetical protein
MPLFTLHVPPRDGPRKTRGQDGFAISFPAGLFHPPLHAGLSRRTGGPLSGFDSPPLRLTTGLMSPASAGPGAHETESRSRWTLRQLGSVVHQQVAGSKATAEPNNFDFGILLALLVNATAALAAKWAIPGEKSGPAASQCGQLTCSDRARRLSYIECGFSVSHRSRARLVNGAPQGRRSSAS